MAGKREIVDRLEMPERKRKPRICGECVVFECLPCTQDQGIVCAAGGGRASGRIRTFLHFHYPACEHSPSFKVETDGMNSLPNTAEPSAPSPRESPQQSAQTVDTAGLGGSLVDAWHKMEHDVACDACSGGGAWRAPEQHDDRPLVTLQTGGDGSIPQEWISGSIRHGVLNAASHKHDTEKASAGDTESRLAALEKRVDGIADRLTTVDVQATNEECNLARHVVKHNVRIAELERKIGWIDDHADWHVKEDLRGARQDIDSVKILVGRLDKVVAGMLLAWKNKNVGVDFAWVDRAKACEKIAAELKKP